MRAATSFTSWNCTGFPGQFWKQQLPTTNRISSELLASIQLYSDIKEIGKNMLASNGHKDLGKSFLTLQSYIRQAVTFYEAAEVLHYRASPLIYYYSFMNFAKAYICLRDPMFVDIGLTHGLMAGREIGALKRHNLTVKANGVFPLFLKKLTNAAIPSGTKLRITDLLGYVHEVGFEYQTLKFGEPRAFPVRYFICIGPDGKAHVLLGIAHFGSKYFGNASLILEKDYEPVTLDTHTFCLIFNESAELLPGYKFFESKKRYNPLPSGALDRQTIIDDTVGNLSKCISYDPYPNKNIFKINTYVVTQKRLYFNDVLAIYCCTYYLGSLIRYRPQVLETMLTTKDAWMIERFVMQTPITFLRHIRNLIDGNYYAYSNI
jgi:hypothetical protein